MDVLWSFFAENTLSRHLVSWSCESGFHAFEKDFSERSTWELSLSEVACDFRPEIRLLSFCMLALRRYRFNFLLHIDAGSYSDIFAIKLMNSESQWDVK